MSTLEKRPVQNILGQNALGRTALGQTALGQTVLGRIVHVHHLRYMTNFFISDFLGSDCLLTG